MSQPTEPFPLDLVAVPESNAALRLEARLDAQALRGLYPLLERGVLLRLPVNASVAQVLTAGLGLALEFIASRVQTVFLDSKPVDDLEVAVVREGSVLALSAAMPGLVGATMRRGGVLAGFRSGISATSGGGDREAENDAGGRGQARTGLVTVKLFNMLREEVGAGLLRAGVWVRLGALRDLGEVAEECFPVLASLSGEQPETLVFFRVTST